MTPGGVEASGLVSIPKGFGLVDRPVLTCSARKAVRKEARGTYASS